MICGDMGSDHLALPFLLGCGLRKFSVVVSDIPKLKSLVSRYSIAETEALARGVPQRWTAQTQSKPAWKRSRQHIDLRRAGVQGRSSLITAFLRKEAKYSAKSCSCFARSSCGATFAFSAVLFSPAGSVFPATSTRA